MIEALACSRLRLLPLCGGGSGESSFGAVATVLLMMPTKLSLLITQILQATKLKAL